MPIDPPVRPGKTFPMHGRNGERLSIGQAHVCNGSYPVIRVSNGDGPGLYTRRRPQASNGAGPRVEQPISNAQVAQQRSRSFNRVTFADSPQVEGYSGAVKSNGAARLI